MLKSQLLPLFGFVAALILSLFSGSSVDARARHEREHCAPSSSCGNLEIKSPFRLRSDPIGCGDRRLELVCSNNRTVLSMKHGEFYVKQISHANFTILLVDPTSENGDCSIPRSSLILEGGTCKDTPYSRLFYDLSGHNYWSNSSTMFLVNCKVPINSSVYVGASPCDGSDGGGSSGGSSSSTGGYFYFLDEYTPLSDFHQSCRIEAQVPTMLPTIIGLSTSDIYRELSKGFQLSWAFYDHDCSSNSPWIIRILSVPFVMLLRHVSCVGAFILHRQYFFDATKESQIICAATTGGIILIRTFLGISLLVALMIHKCRRRHCSVDDTIENFLRNQNDLMPIRYSYSEIKKMTGGFREKLGQGGYGSVFKGKLRSGRQVAIKLLSGKSKANGQDFINEVSTIGRIHHVHVMRLIGFCVEGSKQALVYDFMPNGSLDKIIFSQQSDTDKTSLSWQKVFDIAIGVARGIEYLHRGCDMQILHFDIKPHNILLDERFLPKVSDFGLAKLYPVDDSIVSLTAARGTLGYIAPELFYKNIGGVSYKADVYSFGMLLLEMVGRRRNLNALAEQSSQIYFPSWMYDRLDRGETIELGDAEEEYERTFVKKMAIVALWCIQMKPGNRPSMSQVLEMLEDEVELLEMPPKPFLHSLAKSESD